MSDKTKKLVSPVYAFAGDGVVATEVLDSDYPTVFVLLIPTDVDGNQVTGASGTVTYEIRTENNDEWVSINADSDLAAPEDSSFRAPVVEIRATVATGAGFSYCRLKAVQYKL